LKELDISLNSSPLKLLLNLCLDSLPIRGHFGKALVASMEPMHSERLLASHTFAVTESKAQASDNKQLIG
jgi:hypothetical protein